jgi:hypothetical protein
MSVLSSYMRPCNSDSPVRNDCVALHGVARLCCADLIPTRGPGFARLAARHAHRHDCAGNLAPTVTPDQVWTFARHAQRLELRRRLASDGFMFVVNGDGPARSYFFTDLEPLVAFHRDMEWFLLRTGWSLVAYSPERRVLRDRRKVLRTNAPDRRRTMPDFPVADGSG